MFEQLSFEGCEWRDSMTRLNKPIAFLAEPPAATIHAQAAQFVMPQNEANVAQGGTTSKRKGHVALLRFAYAKLHVESTGGTRECSVNLRRIDG